MDQKKLKVNNTLLKKIKECAAKKFINLSVSTRHSDIFMSRCYTLAVIEILTSKNMLDIIIEEEIFDE